MAQAANCSSRDRQAIHALARLAVRNTQSGAYQTTPAISRRRSPACPWRCEPAAYPHPETGITAHTCAPREEVPSASPKRSLQGRQSGYPLRRPTDHPERAPLMYASMESAETPAFSWPDAISWGTLPRFSNRNAAVPAGISRGIWNAYSVASRTISARATGAGD